MTKKTEKPKIPMAKVLKMNEKKLAKASGRKIVKK